MVCESEDICRLDSTRASILTQALVNLAALISRSALAERLNSDALSLGIPRPKVSTNQNSSGLLLLVDPFLCFLRRVTVGLILSRQCVTELILM